LFTDGEGFFLLGGDFLSLTKEGSELRPAASFDAALILITQARETPNRKKWIGLLFNDSGVQNCVVTKKPSKSKQAKT